MAGSILLLMVVACVIIGVWYTGSDSWKIWPYLLAIGLVVAVGSGALMVDYYQIEERVVVVEGKDRGGDDGSYRVYTDGDTLGVTDIWLPGRSRFDSADVFADVPVCHRIRVEVYGWEFGPMSLMPNIIEWEDLGEVESCEERV